MAGEPTKLTKRIFQEKNISIAVFAAYSLPLFLSFLLFAARPDNAKGLLALFIILGSAATVFLIHAIKTIVTTSPRKQAPHEDRNELHENSLKNRIRDLEQQIFDREINLKDRHTAIATLEKEKKRLEAFVQELQENMRLKEKCLPQEDIDKEIENAIANEREQAGKELESIRAKLQEKDHALVESDKRHELLLKELANARFELETLIKLEVQQRSQENDQTEQKERIQQEKRGVYSTPYSAPPPLTSSLLYRTKQEADQETGQKFSLPPSLRNRFEIALPQSAHDAVPADTLGSSHTFASRSPLSCDQELTRLLAKTGEMSTGSIKSSQQSSGQQLELPSFLDLSIESLAIEKRRLFDALKNDCELPCFVFNCLDSKIIFTSATIKSSLGISTDRFQKEFFSLVGEAEEHIRRALLLLKPGERTKIPLQIRRSPNEEIPVLLSLGICPQPPFSRCAIAVMEIAQ